MVIRTDRLTKDFSVGFWRRRPHRALDGVSLDVPAGGVYGLLGPNGAGKSTTLKILTGLLWPTSGRAEVFDRAPHEAAARRRLGFLPEHPTFYDHLTAEELLAYFGGLAGLTGPSLAERAGRLLDTVGLGADRRRPLRQYSKGMLQRVGLAQALIGDPDLVILDEPMSGLDPIGRREVRSLILRLRDEGRTVLFSSHILSDAELLCSRVGILAGGRLVASGRVDELTAGPESGGRGWEVTLAGVSADLAARLVPQAERWTEISPGRYNLDLAAAWSPERLVGWLEGTGAALVSVTPLRTSLEDVFVARVRQAAPPDSGAPARAGTA